MFGLRKKLERERDFELLQHSIRMIANMARLDILHETLLFDRRSCFMLPQQSVNRAVTDVASLKGQLEMLWY